MPKQGGFSAVSLLPRRTLHRHPSGALGLFLEVSPGRPEAREHQYCQEPGTGAAVLPAGLLEASAAPLLGISRESLLGRELIQHREPPMQWFVLRIRQLPSPASRRSEYGVVSTSKRDPTYPMPLLNRRYRVHAEAARRRVAYCGASKSGMSRLDVRLESVFFYDNTRQ
jgi:hypothetical protein